MFDGSSPPEPQQQPQDGPPLPQTLEEWRVAAEGADARAALYRQLMLDANTAIGDLRVELTMAGRRVRALEGELAQLRKPPDPPAAPPAPPAAPESGAEEAKARAAS